MPVWVLMAAPADIGNTKIKFPACAREVSSRLAVAHQDIYLGLFMQEEKPQRGYAAEVILLSPGNAFPAMKQKEIQDLRSVIRLRRFR